MINAEGKLCLVSIDMDAYRILTEQISAMNIEKKYV